MDVVIRSNIAGHSLTLSGDWSAQAVLVLDAGEALTTIASDSRKVLGS